MKICKYKLPKLKFGNNKINQNETEYQKTVYNFERGNKHVIAIEEENRERMEKKYLTQ